MKHDKWISFSLASLMTFMLSFACAGCLATAFSLGRQADLVQIAFWCICISVISSLLPTLRVGWLMPCILAVLALILWNYSELKESFMALLHNISVYCDTGYDCGVLEWEGFEPEKVDCTLALQAISSMVAMFCGWCISERRGCSWAILIAVIAFAPCTLVLFSVPDEKYLLLLLSTILLLLLTQNVRIQNEHEGNRLTVFLFLPVLLAALLLFVLLPQDQYDGRERAEQLLAKIQPYLNIGDTKRGNSQPTAFIDLQNMSSQDTEDRKVMTVTATEDGTYYLRGRAYDTYTGLTWQESTESCDLPWQPCGEYVADITLKTSKVESVLYLPYYTEELVMLEDIAHLDNSSDLKNYTYRCYQKNSKFRIKRYSAENFATLTYLPPETLSWAKEYLQELYGDRVYFAEAIAAHVRSSAKYDLNAPIMDDGYSDFTQWFLEDSDTGFCVHFATATAVLLRAAGIPARYVTGYTVEAEANRTVNIKQTDAHAWVEYWTAEDGWQILEATPSLSNEYVPETTEPSTEDSTQDYSEMTTEPEPTQTEESVEPTESAEKTEPTEKPTLPGESSGQDATTPSEDIDEQIDHDEEPQTQNRTVQADNAWKLPGFVKWLVIIFLLIAALIAQWRIRVARILRKLKIGNNNDRALMYWQQLLRYTSVMEIQPERAVYHLICKAKFSQHTIIDEELQYLQEYVQRYIHKLRNRPWYKRLYDRLILALY